MSDRSESSGGQRDEPLFQNMDEQERVYAPEQVPGGGNDPTEVDVGGTAAKSSAVAAQDSDIHEPDTEPGRANIAGAEGNQRTVPVVGVRPDVSSANPAVMSPASLSDADAPSDDSEADQGRV